MIGETVTLLKRTASGRDSHGNQTYTWAETDIPGCVVWPTGSTEQVQGQDQTSERLSVLFPYGTDVPATARARARGLLYEVQGVPSSWSSPFTATKAGVEVQLTRVAG